MSELIENLPEGYFCGGDNAYINSKHLLVPFPGQNLPQCEDSFNYFLSQLCVHIKNAFAQLVICWGILWQLLQVPPLKQQPALIKCLCKLHNFCIDENERVSPVMAPGSNGTPAIVRVCVESEFNTQVLADQAEWMTSYVFQ